MRTTRELLAAVAVDGHDLPCRFADLLVVERDDGSIDWECVLVTAPGLPLVLEPVRVTLDGHDSSRREGDAIVVRSDGESHVLRGVAPLEPPDTTGHPAREHDDGDGDGHLG